MHVCRTTERKTLSASSVWLCSSKAQKNNRRKSLCMWLAVYILWAPYSPSFPSSALRSGVRVRGERRGCGLSLLEERSWCWRSPRPAPQFSLWGEKPPPPPLPHIWLPPERSFGGKTRMFLFPRREEELQSETTELKHREASWALTQSAARPWWRGVSLLSLTLLQSLCSSCFFAFCLISLFKYPSIWTCTHFCRQTSWQKPLTAPSLKT